MLELEESILPIVQGTWESMLQLPALEEDIDVPRTVSLPYAGVITVSGEWEGAIGLFVTEGMGRQAASSMFATPHDGVTTQDLQDALAELTNVVGGNLKGLLPPPCQLGLPVVVEGSDYRMQLPGSTQTITRRFRCNDDIFEVVVVERLSS